MHERIILLVGLQQNVALLLPWNSDIPASQGGNEDWYMQHLEELKCTGENNWFLSQAKEQNVTLTSCEKMQLPHLIKNNQTGSVGIILHLTPQSTAALYQPFCYVQPFPQNINL